MCCCRFCRLSGFDRTGCWQHVAAHERLSWREQAGTGHTNTQPCKLQLSFIVYTLPPLVLLLATPVCSSQPSCAQHHVQQRVRCIRRHVDVHACSCLHGSLLGGHSCPLCCTVPSAATTVTGHNALAHWEMALPCACCGGGLVLTCVMNVQRGVVGLFCGFVCLRLRRNKCLECLAMSLACGLQLQLVFGGVQLLSRSDCGLCSCALFCTAAQIALIVCWPAEHPQQHRICVHVLQTCMFCHWQPRQGAEWLVVLCADDTSYELPLVRCVGR